MSWQHSYLIFKGFVSLQADRAVEEQSSYSSQTTNPHGQPKQKFKIVKCHQGTQWVVAYNGGLVECFTVTHRDIAAGKL